VEETTGGGGGVDYSLVWLKWAIVFGVVFLFALFFGGCYSGNEMILP